MVPQRFSAELCANITCTKLCSSVFFRDAEYRRIVQIWYQRVKSDWNVAWVCGALFVCMRRDLDLVSSWQVATDLSLGFNQRLSTISAETTRPRRWNEYLEFTVSASCNVATR